MEVPAKGFLPKASTLEPVILPNDENPMTKDANMMAMANRYLSACIGVMNGDVKLFLITPNILPLKPLPKNLVFISISTYI